MMRALTSSLVLSLCCACTPAPQATPSIVGHYVRLRVNARDDPDWIGIVGDWSAEYRNDGNLIVHGANSLTVDSRYRLEGDVPTLTDIDGSGSCRLDGVDDASGQYGIRFVGDELHFSVLHDECGGRRSVITRHPLRRLR